MASRILVVEDDLVMAKLVRRALERAGYTVTHAAGAEEAGTLLSTEDYDLVVMDLFLPDGDGLAICHQIRSAQGTPVVMISSLEEDIGNTIVDTPLGPQAFLSKPFNFGAFVEQVGELIGAS